MNNSAVFIFDGSWDGLLSAVFDVFVRKVSPDELLRNNTSLPIFADSVHEVLTDSEHAKRVWHGLEVRLKSNELAALTACFLAEQENMDIVILRYIVKVFTHDVDIARDFTDADALAVFDTARKVHYERLRILQFMRFQKAADGTYFGLMEPIYNVMPMAVAHFVDRFADQKFILYDKRRGFGYYYDGTRATEITLDGAMPHIVGGKIDETLMAEDELLFQKMWQTYFKAIAIKERANPRKQRQDMPMRFWKYLTEKQSII